MRRIIQIALIFVLIALGVSTYKRTNPDPPPTVTEVSGTPELSTPPAPAILCMLDEYYSSHEDDDDYQIKMNPTLVDSADEEYEMDLILDKDTSEAYGVANVIANTGLESFRVCFPYSNARHDPSGSLLLIRTVSAATVRALCEDQEIEGADGKVDRVVKSYNGDDYTRIITVGDYAVFFIPDGILDCPELRAIKYDEFLDGVDISDYADGTFEDLNANPFETKKYHVRGTVANYISGTYLRGLNPQKCKLLTVVLKNGGTVTMTQDPDKMPISFVKGAPYDFYGKTMVSITGSVYFNLQYAEREPRLDNLMELRSKKLIPHSSLCLTIPSSLFYHGGFT